MYTGGPTTDKGLIVRVIIAFIFLLLCGYQIWAGIKLMSSNNKPPREITDADLATLTVGEEVSGTIDNIIMEYVGDSVLNDTDVAYFISKTDDGRIMSYRAECRSNMYFALSALITGGEPVSYRGAVHAMTGTTRGFLNMQLIAQNVLPNNGITVGTQEAMLPFVIDIAPETAKVDDRYIVFTFIGAGLMLVFAFLVMRKPLKNLRQSVQVRKGEYQPELKVRQEDLVFENEGYYEGMKDGETDFFVNTQYNIRGEGDTSLIRDRTETADAQSEDGDDLPPTAPMTAPPEDFFYQGNGTNDDGNFFVDDNTKGYSRRY